MRKQILYIFLFLLSFFLSDNSFAFTYETIINQPSEELLQKGNAYYEANVLDTALVYYIALTHKYDEQSINKSAESAIIGYIRIGDIYNQQSNYHKALDFYFEGFRISEKENIKTFLPELYKNMGNIYNMFLDYEEGKNFYKQGLTLAEELKDPEMQWKILNNLIGVCCYGKASAEDLQEAKDYYQRSLTLTIEDEALHEYYRFFSKAYIDNQENKLDSARINFERALEHAIEMKMEPVYCYHPASMLALFWSEEKQYDKSLEYHIYCNQISQENELAELMLYSLGNLSTTYREIGNREKAQHYKTLYLDLQDSLFNIKEFNRIKNSQLIYEMEKVNKQIDVLNAEKDKSILQVKKQKNILLIISGSLLLLLIFFITVYHQKRKLTKAYINLFERNNEIIKTEKANRKQREEYEKRLEEKNRELQQLLKEMDKPLPEVTVTKEASSQREQEEDTDLNKSITLSEDQKQKLIADISLIMETTHEFCDCEFSLVRLAELVGSNTKYVSYIINEEYQKNFRTYINEYRIKEASIRLVDTEKYGNYTLKAIAESVGFKSHTTFIHMFKKITGINPSTYQKIAKNQL